MKIPTHENCGNILSHVKLSAELFAIAMLLFFHFRASESCLWILISFKNLSNRERGLRTCAVTPLIRFLTALHTRINPPVHPPDFPNHRLPLLTLLFFVSLNASNPSAVRLKSVERRIWARNSRVERQLKYSLPMVASRTSFILSITNNDKSSYSFKSRLNACERLPLFFLRVWINRIQSVGNFLPFQYMINNALENKSFIVKPVKRDVC